MPFDAADIDDLYEWSDENSERGNGSPRGAEEMRVGTKATSFEQMLERELAKDQNGRNSSEKTHDRPSTKPRQTFLKKGARGWWMEKPDAKVKMQKHVLASKDQDADDAENQRKRRPSPPPPRTAASDTKPSRDLNRLPARSASPEPSRRTEVETAQISPMRIPSGRREDATQQAEDIRRTLPMWANANREVRTNESVETLGMSGVRHAYEVRREQEADELADFEALERELAAEKESYLREKRLSSVNDSYHAQQDHHCGDASWFRDSEDDASLHGESFHVAASPHRSSHGNFDLGGDSAMVFDGSHVFRSPVPRSNGANPSDNYSNNNNNKTRSVNARQSFAPSDISAVSLNDSEPWGDAGNASDHFSRLPESPIAKHGMNSVLLRPGVDDGQRSRGSLRDSHRDFLWTGKGADRAVEDEDHVDESLHHYDDYDVVDRSERNRERSLLLRSNSAPVSNLVQQVFGDARSRAFNDDEEEKTRPSEMQGRSSVKQPSTTAKNRSGAANSTQSKSSAPNKAATRTAGSQNNRSAPKDTDQELIPTQRRRTPTFSAAGTLPIAVEDKLAELEEEVRFYKSETLQLQKKKAQYDDELQRLARGKEELARYQDEQRRLIEQEWEHERQKMRREEKMFERQVKLKLSAAASSASRKDRGEIDALKAQIVKMQLDAKQSATKSKSTNDALRLRIAELEGKNRELSEEVTFLERDRLDQWQKHEVLLKELQTQKQKQDNGNERVTTVGDITRIGRSAEQLIHSVGLHVEDRHTPATTMTSSATSRSAFPSSVASTPTYANEDGYNPGRYRQEGLFSRPPASPVTVSSPSQSSAEKPTSRHPDSGYDDHDEPEAKFEDGASSDVEDEVTHPGGKREITYRDGTKRIFFADGNEKEISPNGHVVIRFTNGDLKEFFPTTGVSVYHYHEAQTKLTTYPDKTKVYEFPNQQIEKSYPDGTTEIVFADGIKKVIHSNGDEFSTFPDGTTMLENKDGMREVTLLSGKRVRYHPNGKMALVGLDGQESEIRSDEELKELMENL